MIKSTGALPAPVLFLSLVLLSLKPALFFNLFLRPADDFALQFGFFPLQLQRLLRFCAHPGLQALLSRFPLHPFGVGRRAPYSGLHSRTEPEPAVILQNKLPHLTVPGFCPKCDLARGLPVIVHPLKHTDPKGVFKKYRQLSVNNVHNEALLKCAAYKERTTRRGRLLT